MPSREDFVWKYSYLGLPLDEESNKTCLKRNLILRVFNMYTIHMHNSLNLSEYPYNYLISILISVYLWSISVFYIRYIAVMSIFHDDIVLSQWKYCLLRYSPHAVNNS